MPRYLRAELAPAGSIGNNTHAPATIPPSISEYAIHFHVEAVCATPTVTFSLEGSLDSDDVPASEPHWFTMALTPAGIGASVESVTLTAVGGSTTFVTTGSRFAQRVRLKTTANTNVTYHAHMTLREG